MNLRSSEVTNGVCKGYTVRPLRIEDVSLSQPWMLMWAASPRVVPGPISPSEGLKKKSLAIEERFGPVIDRGNVYTKCVKWWLIGSILLAIERVEVETSRGMNKVRKGSEYEQLLQSHTAGTKDSSGSHILRVSLLGLLLL